ncbi:hypothetical protein C8R43DRAFT_1230783 [Mycena crocata]|nr:hypothetical protein C8R43DRAFT_1230783 [Mycena crocata]
MFWFLRSIYHRIRTRMGSISLPDPSGGRPALGVFYPVTQKNRKRVEATLRLGERYSERKCSELCEQLVNVGDQCEVVEFLRAEYCERKALPLHEFVVVWYIIPTDPEPKKTEHFMIFERRCSDRTATKDPMEIIRCVDIEPPRCSRHSQDDTQPSTPLITPQSRSSSSTSSIFRAGAMKAAQSSLDLSKNRRLAKDNVLIFYEDCHDHIQEAEDEYYVLRRFEAPSICSITMSQLLVLSATIHQAMPLYAVFETQCFLYARIFWSRLISLCAPEADGHVPAFHVKSAGLGRGACKSLCEKMKKHVDERVDDELKELAITTRHKAAWTQFLADCMATKEVLDRPLLAAESARLAAESAQLAAESELAAERSARRALEEKIRFLETKASA